MKKNVVILGSGESGTGAALLAKHLGHDVFVSDQGVIKATYQDVLSAHGIAFEANQHSMARILAADEIIKSPGIPEKSDVMLAIRAKGIHVIGEIELGYLHAGACTIIAITGSNGKTTSTNLIFHLLHTAGLPVRMGGNVGQSFAQMVYDDLSTGSLATNRIFVLEVSSFQLDDIEQFRPNMSVLLNITPDHLDRYEYQMEKYIASKFRIAMNQRDADLFITNADDSNIQDYIKMHPRAVQCVQQVVKKSDLLDGYARVDSLAFDLASSALKGPHNLFNAACAIRVALELGIESEVIGEALYTFRPPPHRMEKVAEIDGITYINDSKATNIDSTFHALQSMEGPTVWIVGGVDKGNDYNILMPYVRQYVKAIVCLGVDNSRLLEAYSAERLPISEARSIAEVFEHIATIAEQGDTVLLSPACASFDLFKNYEDRGDQFRAAVLQLQSK